MTNFILRYPNGTTFDMTDDVEHNSLRISGRCDEAFAVGSCRAFTTLDKNIPPYTLCEIDGKPYLCSSECTKYQNKNNLYVHNISILELTAILECFILGTKVLSRGNDKTKLSHILELINDKYGVHIMTTLTLENLLQTQTNDYVFGSGTTLFDVATQMMVRLNQRPKVLSVSYNNGQMQMSIDSIALSNNGTAYALDWNKITQHTLNQNTENYSKWLETEANNVVDRNNLAYDMSLTIRNKGETRLTLDNGKLYTTAKIESVKKFEVQGEVRSFTIQRLGAKDFFNAYYLNSTPTFDGTAQQNNYDETTMFSQSKTLSQWFNNVADFSLLRTKLEQYCAYAGVPYDELVNNYVFTCSKVGAYDETNIWYHYDEGGTRYRDPYYCLTATAIIRTRTDITEYILEKNVYDAENYAIQPKYCYYTKGNNIIDGLHITRNDELWGKIASVITGACNGPMLDEIAEDKGFTPYETTQFLGTATHGCEFIVGYRKNYGGYGGTNGPSFSYDSALWNVQYVPITNPRMIETKTDTPQNETAYKPFTRTYQVGASEIDYDRLVDSMKQYCDMLGKPELTIEYDITGVNTLPVLAQKCNDPVSNTDYFLMSYEIVYHTTHTIMTLNLCKSYYKVAEAIGVAYQYNATRLPVEGIIERPIHLDIIANNVNLDDDCYLILIFKVDNNDQHNKYLITRYCLLENGNKKVLYCEADDQFSFGSKVTQYDATAICTEYVPYADDNSEVVSVACELIRVDNLTSEQSKEMPNIPTGLSYTILATSNLQKVYKDAREKLTFTIEIK